MTRCARLTRELRPCRRDGQWRSTVNFTPSVAMCYQHALANARQTRARTMIHSRGRLLTICQIPPDRRRYPRTGPPPVGNTAILRELADIRTEMELHRVILAVCEQFNTLTPAPNPDGVNVGIGNEYHPIRLGIREARTALRAREPVAS